MSTREDRVEQGGVSPSLDLIQGGSVGSSRFCLGRPAWPSIKTPALSRDAFEPADNTSCKIRDKFCIANENNHDKKGNSKVNMTESQDDDPQRDNMEVAPEVHSPEIPQNGSICSDEVKKDTNTVQVGC